MANELNVFYDNKSIPIRAIDTLPQTTYALFMTETTPNFAGPPINRDGLAEAIGKCTLPKDKIEIMEFEMKITPYIAKILNIKDSGEIPRMRI